MAPSDKHSCNKCKKNINLRTQKYIFCSGECLKVWHVPQCINVSEEKCDEISSDSEKHWFCEVCKQKRTQRRSIRPSYESPISTPSSFTNNTTITFEKIMQELSAIRQQQNSFQKSLDDIKTVINDYKEIVENLTQENIALRNNNETLHNKINNIECHLDNNAQQALAHNIIINGITEEVDEDTTQIVIKVCKAMNIDIDRNQIETVQRKKTANENSGFPGSLVVKFSDKNVRDNIITSKIKYRITNKSLNSKASDRPIYISEQLTTRKQYLFKIARDCKREKMIEYAWVKNGDILIRKTANSRVVQVKNLQQLTQIKQLHETQSHQ